MRDLHSRWNLLVVILALGTLVGCGALQADPRTPQQTDLDNSGLSATGGALNFGSVVVGSQVQAWEFVYNPTGSSVTITGANPGSKDVRAVSSFPITVAARKGTTLVFRYSPSAPGKVSSTILISSNAPQPTLSLPTSAQAITAGNLVVTQASVTFGSVQVGKSQSQAESFTNSGETSVTISQVTVSSGDFTVGGLALPVTLNPSQSVNFNLLFTPKASGTFSGSVSANATVSMVAPTSGTQASVQNVSQWSASSKNEVARIAVAGRAMPVSSSGTTVGQITGTPLSFGSPLVGSTQSKPLVITNTGTASVTVTQASAGGPGYTMTGPTLPLTLAGNQTASFTVTFAPQTAGAANGTVTVASTAANPTLSVALSATPVTPGVLTISSNPVAFGTVPVGSSQKTSATLTNSGGSSVTLTQATVTGNGFSMSSMGMPMTLAPKQSANVSLTCAPQSAGTLTGSLSIASDATNANVAVPLTATAVAAGALTVSPSSLSFGSVPTGTTQSLPATLTNSGGSSVTVTSSAFSGTGYSTTGLTLPMTLLAGQSVGFSVAFAPQTAGTDNFSLSINSNASNATLAVFRHGHDTGEFDRQCQQPQLWQRHSRQQPEPAGNGDQLRWRCHHPDSGCGGLGVQRIRSHFALNPQCRTNCFV